MNGTSPGTARRAPRVAAAALAALVAAAARPADAQRPPVEAPPAATAAAARAGAAPRDLEAVRAALARLGADATCRAESGARARCHWTHAGADRVFDLHLVLDDVTATAYVYVANLATARPGAADTPARLARLLELNWRLLAAELEWNPIDGEIRLTAVLHTDSGLDARALTAVVRGLERLAAQHHRTL